MDRVGLWLLAIASVIVVSLGLSGLGITEWYVHFGVGLVLALFVFI